MPTAAPRSSTAKTRSKTASTRKTTPDAIMLLKQDHREAEEIFEQIEKARSPDRKKALAEKVCMALKVHTQIEEEIFYPACRGEVEDDLVDEAKVEHDSAKQLIAEIEAGSPEDDLWEAKVTVLSEYIKHHVKEEEQPGGMFSQARKAKMDLKAIGEQLAARKAELMQQMKALQPN